MRLYVNTTEVQTLKRALTTYAETVYADGHDPEIVTVLRLIERVELCEKLQDNVKKSVETVEN